MDYYCEFARQPYKRSGKMIPVSTLPQFYELEDAGYSTYYWFTKEAADEIRAQGHSAGLSRFPVYSRYLVIDIDREDNLELAKADTDTISVYLRTQSIKHSVWMSGGKGYHVYIHTDPMFGIFVPHSHLMWVKSIIVELLGVKVDESLYQHGRLLSNPGRKSVKTGIRKHKIGDYPGATLSIPREDPPARTPRPEGLGNRDLARIAFFRASKVLESDPSSRHTTIWSLAGAFAEAGATEEFTIGVLEWVNQFWKDPKDSDGLKRAVNQAFQQTLQRG